MANHYFGIDIGGGLDPSGVSTGTSSTSKKVELVIQDGVTGNNKMEILKAIEAIESAIIEGNAPA
jgi:ribonuclease HI